ncbi:hypothetical protein HPP92_003571 [Vanilla planifolia]|uniref:Uncharacterized protein n=1 Tax=Vanilla planifolia TaxID=51239 RepID=A0A835S8I6_VANPL|nr:hypothetical protein HPP92_003954 [Vanilla planifolia]KAG0503499.1 hypothetical protein HPP92_003571 [Vanilla planifolia]
MTVNHGRCRTQFLQTALSLSTNMQTFRFSSPDLALRWPTHNNCFEHLGLFRLKKRTTVVMPRRPVVFSSGCRSSDRSTGHPAIWKAVDILWILARWLE